MTRSPCLPLEALLVTQHRPGYAGEFGAKVRASFLASDRTYGPADMA
jgi:hypothetical protein